MHSRKDSFLAPGNLGDLWKFLAAPNGRIQTQEPGFQKALPLESRHCPCPVKPLSGN